MSVVKLYDLIQRLDAECDGLKTRADVWQVAAENAQAENKRLRRALVRIGNMPLESVWSDSRDDAAEIMVDIAREALGSDENL